MTRHAPIVTRTTCDHHTLNQSLVGLHCPACRTTWAWTDSLAMSQVYQQMCARYDALEHRVLGLEDAVTGALGLVQCVRCHGYDQPTNLFTLLGGLRFCVECLRDTLDDPDDELLDFSPELADGLIEQIARQAFRLHVADLNWSVLPELQRAIDSLRRTDGATVHSLTD